MNGTRAFKYGRIIKHLFKTTTNTLTKGGGLLLKSLHNRKSNYIYWDDPNELVDGQRLLLSSEGADYNNHRNEIIIETKFIRRVKEMFYTNKFGESINKNNHKDKNIVIEKYITQIYDDLMKFFLKYPCQQFCSRL